MQKKFITIINYNKNTFYKCTTSEPVKKMNYNYFVGKKTTKNESYYEIKEEQDKDWFDNQTNKIWCLFKMIYLNLENDVYDNMDSKKWIAFRIKQKELFEYAKKINIKTMLFFHKTYDWPEAALKYYYVDLYGSISHKFLKYHLKKGRRTKIYDITQSILIDRNRFIYFSNKKTNYKVNSIYYDLNDHIIYITIKNNILLQVNAREHDVAFINKN